MTVFTSFMCKQWERRDVNNTLQLLAYYSERMSINTVLFSDNCTFLESIFPNTTVFDVPQVNKFGVPVLRPMFEMVRSHFDSELIMFMNSDILPSYETMMAPLDYYACHPDSKVSSNTFIQRRLCFSPPSTFPLAFRSHRRFFVEVGIPSFSAARHLAIIVPP